MHLFLLLSADATSHEVDAVLRRIDEAGARAHAAVVEVQGSPRQVVSVERWDPALREALGTARGVERVVQSDGPHLLAGRALSPAPTCVVARGARVGDGGLAVFAGPCSVESRAQVEEIALAVKEAGATFLRGGAFKPRTHPYSFQGHGLQGLRWLAEAGEAAGLPVVTEVMTAEDVPAVAEHADVLQVGARSMQSFPLLKALGRQRRPVFLKRGFASTTSELLSAAEYVLAGGNASVILCERGVRTFEPSTRFTLDLGGLASLKQRTHLPVVADPSHAAGRAGLVPPLAKAALAAGADGLMIEVAARPRQALSDGEQALDLPGFARLMDEIRALHGALRRTG